MLTQILLPDQLKMNSFPLVISILLYSLLDAYPLYFWETRQHEPTEQPPKMQPLHFLEAPSNIKAQIKNSYSQLMNITQTFRSYHPHYLHSYSYPKPISPHFYIGQVLPNNRPVFSIRENQTLGRFGMLDHVNEVFYVNGQKQYEYPQNVSLTQKENYKFIAVLQNEHMLDYDIPMQIFVYNFHAYWGIICNLGQGQYKAFILYVSKYGQQAILLDQLPRQIKMGIRNESSLGRMAWRNAERIRWTGHSRIKIESSMEAQVFDVLVLEFQFLSLQAIQTYKVCLKEFKKLAESETAEETILRIKQISINSDEYTFVVQLPITTQTCSQAAQSQVLRGLSYQYGTLVIKNGSNYIPNKPQELLSFTPSRKRFPWGFLWDEGFHCEVVVRTNEIDLALTVIKSWLNTITQTGWIPREQNRGAERQYLCNCPQFMAKDIKDGNPPTLILSLQYLSRKNLLNPNNFEKSYFEKLKKWYNWFFENHQTRQGSYIFRWHDSIMHQGSFNSGLDDFPRLRNSTGHIDCQSWMYFFSKAMADISASLDGDGSQYLQKAENIKKALIFNFINPQTYLPADFSENGTLKIYNKEFGYPSILPIAFGILAENSTEFKYLMQAVQKQLDSGNGLTSISMRSSRYLQKDAYWKGPVWININYLFVKGLFQYYKGEQKYYNKLKTDLINMVCNNLKKSGYFYENYTLGKGTFSYPFTGWTTLISIIVKENY